MYDRVNVDSTINMSQRPSWMSAADVATLLGVSRIFHESLGEMNVPHVWRLSSGGHDFTVWKRDLYEFSQRLFR